MAYLETFLTSFLLGGVVHKRGDAVPVHSGVAAQMYSAYEKAPLGVRVLWQSTMKDAGARLP